MSNTRLLGNGIISLCESKQASLEKDQKIVFRDQSQYSHKSKHFFRSHSFKRNFVFEKDKLVFNSRGHFTAIRITLLQLL